MMPKAVTPWCAGAGATHPGQRPYNEDSFVAAAPVFVVSDGMGGHLAGAAASEAVVRAYLALIPGEGADADFTPTPQDVVDAVATARIAVAEVAAEAGGESGATLTGVVAVEHDGQPWWCVVNVGDSRVYCLANGVLSQVTVDHSRVQQLVDQGRISAEQAAFHPDRNIVTRAIGDEIPGCDIWLVPAHPGDRFIVASDGLTKALTDPQIAGIGALAGSQEDAARRLVEAAVVAGASDNVTVVVADALEAQTADDASSAPWNRWPVAHDHEDDTTLSTRRKVRS